MTSTMSSLKRQRGDGEEEEVGLAGDVREHERDDARHEDAERDTARIQSTPSRVAHAEVYPPTIANAACENANCPDTPKTK